jgi:threonine aldolase
LGKIIDLRSDTVTTTSLAMRQAMADAKVGDDMYGEDPTVKILEDTVAKLLGKEAALFVPSGTMANQMALLLHCRHGDSVIAEEKSHFALFESGGAAAMAGVQIETVSPQWLPSEMKDAYRGTSLHLSSTSLVVFENTHNVGGGEARSLEVTHQVLKFAKQLGLKTHLDGARIWNASVALGVSEKELTSGFDTVSVCFSKGLGAPVGSALCLDRVQVDQAKKLRKRLGGAMRQSGHLAAACLLALNNRARLIQDHEHSKVIGQFLSEEGFEVKPAAIPTNMVFFKHRMSQGEDLVQVFDQVGIKASYIGWGWARLVTHLDFTAADLDEFKSRIKRIKI